MLKSELIDYFKNFLVDDSSFDPGLAEDLFDDCDEILWNNRDWWFARKHTTQSTTRSGADYVTHSTTDDTLTMNLPSDFLRPFDDWNNTVAFVEVNKVPYPLYDIGQKNHLNGRAIYIDWENSRYVITPLPNEALTIDLNYIKQRPALGLSTAPSIPTQFQKIIPYVMAAKYALREAGIDTPPNTEFINGLKGDGATILEAMAMMNEKITSMGKGRRIGISTRYIR